jgi:hypothetical protein
MYGRNWMAFPARFVGERHTTLPCGLNGLLRYWRTELHATAGDTPVLSQLWRPEPGIA